MNLRTVGEAAELLGVSPSTVRNWIEKGYIGAVRLPSGHRRISEAEVERLLGDMFEFAAPEPEEATRTTRASAVPRGETWGP